MKKPKKLIFLEPIRPMAHEQSSNYNKDVDVNSLVQHLVVKRHAVLYFFWPHMKVAREHISALVKGLCIYMNRVCGGINATLGSAAIVRTMVCFMDIACTPRDIVSELSNNYVAVEDWPDDHTLMTPEQFLARHELRTGTVDQPPDALLIASSFEHLDNFKTTMWSLRSHGHIIALCHDNDERAGAETIELLPPHDVDCDIMYTVPCVHFSKVIADAMMIVDVKSCDREAVIFVDWQNIHVATKWISDYVAAMVNFATKNRRCKGVRRMYVFMDQNKVPDAVAYMRALDTAGHDDPRLQSLAHSIDVVHVDASKPQEIDSRIKHYLRDYTSTNDAVLLVSGDRDFSADLARLAQRGNPVYLVHNTQAWDTFKQNKHWADAEDYLNLPELDKLKSHLIVRQKQRRKEKFSQSGNYEVMNPCTNPRCDLDHLLLGPSVHRKLCSLYKQGRCTKQKCEFRHEDCSECGPGVRHHNNTLQCPAFTKRLQQIGEGHDVGVMGIAQDWVQVKQEDRECAECKLEFVGPTMLAEHMVSREHWETTTGGMSYDCIVCNLEFTSALQKDQHLVGRRHYDTLVKRNQMLGLPALNEFVGQR